MTVQRGDDRRSRCYPRDDKSAKCVGDSVGIYGAKIEHRPQRIRAGDPEATAAHQVGPVPGTVEHDPLARGGGASSPQREVYRLVGLVPQTPHKCGGAMRRRCSAPDADHGCRNALFLRRWKIGERGNVVMEADDAAISMPSAPGATTDTEAVGRSVVNQTVVKLGIGGEIVWKVDVTGVVWHSQVGKHGSHFRPSFLHAEGDLPDGLLVLEQLGRECQ